MYKHFNLSSINLRAIDKKIDLKFNFDVEPSSIQGDTIVLTTLTGGDHIPFKTTVNGSVITLLLDEWPQPNTEYHIIIEQEIENIAGMKLNSAIRRKLTFRSQILAVPFVKSPYNFQKLEDLEFKWDDTEDSTEYYVELAKENRFYNLIYNTTVYGKEIAPVLPDLLPGQYYFRVRVQKDGDFGVWSAPVTFIYKDVCADDYPEEDGPSADAEMPGAWDDLYNNNGSASDSELDDNEIEVEDDLEVLIAPTNGETPTEFVFEFDRELDTMSGEVVVIRRDF